jgi:hypothetical protein
MINEKFELFTDELFVSDARSIFTMILADVPTAEIAKRLNATEFEIVEVMRLFIKDELMSV